MASSSETAYILVIDDDPLLTKTLKKVLTRAGYIVETASNGQEGITKAKSGFYHLVLCDVRMPGLDGLMTIRHIKGFQEKAGAGRSGFIVITAYDAEDTRKDAFQLGVTDFLRKPFDLEQFLEVIRHHAGSLVRETPEEEVKRLNRKLGSLLETLHSNLETNPKNS